MKASNAVILSALFLLSFQFAHGQGCIMVRNISGFGQYNLADNAFTVSNWQLNTVGRYFKAYREFKGTEDQHVAEKDQSIIESYSVDISISRLMQKGWSLELSVPVTSNSRTASKEHGGAGTARHATHTFGISDMRLTAYKWIFNPTVSQKANVQLGLGIKLPTGDYKYQDYFFKNDSTKVLAPVNASIQLGDGGTGIITQLNAFYFFNKTINAYANFYYLLNPRDQNGVSTLTGRLSGATKTEMLTGNDVYSVPDVYSFRIGFNFDFKKFAFAAGLRNEGVPVRDIFGGNYGLRRPGHNLSVDPGIIYKMSRSSVYAYVPFIISRRINQSIPDAQTSEMAHTYTIGSGGSGDCQIFIGVLFKLL
jgi:hypothetical protein